jgi:FeS assembly SUF system protein
MSEKKPPVPPPPAVPTPAPARPAVPSTLPAEVETKSEALAAAAGAAFAAMGGPGAAAASAAAAAAPAPAEDPPQPSASDAAGTPKADLREEIIDVLHTCYDPEIPVDIYELGLVYGIQATPEGDVTIQMTLTSPSCPVAETLPPEVQKKVASVPGVKSVKVDLVWEPPWGKHLMSEAALLQLGFM